MTKRNADSSVLIALAFVTGFALLAGFAIAEIPRDSLNEIVQASAATESGLDLASIGYKAPVTQIVRVGMAPSR